MISNSFTIGAIPKLTEHSFSIAKLNAAFEKVRPQKVGEIFGMEVWVDPLMKPNTVQLRSKPPRA